MEQPFGLLTGSMHVGDTVSMNNIGVHEKHTYGIGQSLTHSMPMHETKYLFNILVYIS